MFYFRSTFSILLVTILGLCEAVPQLRALGGSGNDHQVQNNSEIGRLNVSGAERNSAVECLRTLENDKVLEELKMNKKFGGQNSSIIFALQRNDTLSAAANLKQSWELNNLTLLHLASFAGRPESVRCLLKEGFDVNTLDALGNTPLHYASSTGKLDNVKFLVESNVCLWCRNKVGQLAVGYASVLAQSQKDRKDLVDYLETKMKAQPHT